MMNRANISLNKFEKKLLRRFWAQFGGRKNAGYHQGKGRKLQALIEMTKVVIPFKHQMSLAERREHFEEVKKSRHRFRTHPHCFVCWEKAEIRHHIIPLNNGGVNFKWNIVSLCRTCHAKIHPHLMKKLIQEADSLYGFMREAGIAHET